MKAFVGSLLLLALPICVAAQTSGPSGAPADDFFGGLGGAPQGVAAPAAAVVPALPPAEPAPATPGVLSADPLVADAAPSVTGAAGLFRVAQATGLRPGTFGLMLNLQYASGKDVVRVDNDARRFIGTLGLSYTPVEYVEAFATLSARAVTSSLGAPELIQSIGDVSLGVKGVYPALDALSVGALLRLNVPAGADQVGVDFGATGIDALGLITSDLRRVAGVPLRFHLNFGLIVDNSEALFPFRLDRIERYGQGVYDYNRFLLAFGVDAPVEYITPFVEWATEFPLNHLCDGRLEQQCVVELGFPSYASWITIGARSQPVAGLSFTAGVDLGVTTAESQGTPAIPAWSLVGALAYNLEPGGTRVVEVPIEVPIEVPVAAAESHVAGLVVEAGTTEPLANVRIHYAGTEFTDQITGADGRFRTFDFAPGTPVTIELSHPDYVAQTLAVAITDEIVSGTVELQPAFAGARISGQASAPDGAEVTIAFRGPDTRDVTVAADGSYAVDLAPGSYEVIVSAAGARTVREPLAVQAGRTQRAWALEPAPANSVVRWTGTHVEIGNDTQKVAFDGANALTPDAQVLLDQLAAELQQQPSVRLLVRAHTDPRDTVSEELELTSTRADAVIAYLASKGVDRSRLEGDGVGAAEPLIPNVTDRNRRMNNRVEFQILE